MDVRRTESGLVVEVGCAEANPLASALFRLAVDARVDAGELRSGPLSAEAEAEAAAAMYRAVERTIPEDRL